MNEIELTWDLQRNNGAEKKQRKERKLGKKEMVDKYLCNLWALCRSCAPLFRGKIGHWRSLINRSKRTTNTWPHVARLPSIIAYANLTAQILIPALGFLFFYLFFIYITNQILITKSFLVQSLAGHIIHQLLLSKKNKYIYII